MSKAKNYKITITKEPGYWKIHIYILKTTPVYEHGNPEPVRHDDSWVKFHFRDDDVALFYWEARFMAWKLKNKMERGTFIRGEEIIYERKG